MGIEGVEGRESAQGKVIIHAILVNSLSSLV